MTLLLLSLRSWALNNLFDNHCTDEEVRRFAVVNEQLYDMTQRMYERTRMLNDFINMMPLHEKDDDLTVEANLRFWDDAFAVEHLDLLPCVRVNVLCPYLDRGVI